MKKLLYLFLLLSFGVNAQNKIEPRQLDLSPLTIGPFNNESGQTEGFVATRGQVPYDVSTNTQVMSRAVCYATQNITSLKIAIPNWYVPTALGSPETGLGTTATVTAGIEYPSGTFTQVKFAGSASGTIPNLTTIFSDYCNVTIPAGAQFWVRIYFVNAAGVYYCDASPTSSLGTGLNAGMSGVADLTVTSGSISGSNLNFPPLAVIGYTNKASFIVLGDSRGVGIGETVAGTTGNYGNITRSFGTNYGYVNESTASSTMASFLAGSTLRQQLWKYATHIIDAYNYNDIWLNSASLATSIANNTTIQNMGHALNKKVYNITIGPHTTSTDSWATTTNQTIAGTGANTVRIGFNTWVRAGSNGQDGYFDVTAPEESALNSGLWLVNGTANYPTTDGTHETSALNAVVAASGVIPPNQFTNPFTYRNGVVSATFGYNSIHQTSLATTPTTDSVVVKESGKLVAMPSIFSTANTYSLAQTFTSGITIGASFNANFANSTFFNSVGTATLTANQAALFPNESGNVLLNKGKGQITLTAGVATVSISGLTTSNKGILTFVSTGGTVSTTWQYKAVCTSGTLTITAITNTNTTDTTDTSTLNYIIIN